MPIPSFPRNVRRILIWIAMLGLGLACGVLLYDLGLGAGYLIGPLVVAGIFGISGAGMRMPRIGLSIAQAVVALMIAESLQPAMLMQAVTLWHVVLIFVVLTLFLSCLVGALVARWAHLDPEVGVWGFLPGMASSVIALSEERGLDSVMVAFLQLMRLIVLIVLLAWVSSFAFVQPPPAPGVAGQTLAGQTPLQASALTVAMIALSALIGRYLHFLPAGTTLSGIAMGLTCTVLGIDFVVEAWVIAGAFALLGTQVGVRVTRPILARGLSVMPKLAAGVLVLLVLSALMGVGLAWIGHVDVPSGLLATVPGSIDAIALIAVNVHADMSFIMVLQVARLFVVVLFGPLVCRLVIGLFQWSSSER
ncbi:AbrB family transcriptional regulator [Pseudochelatococcus sp. B33]